MVASAGIAASLMAGVRYSAVSEYTTNDGFYYSPTDTRIIPVSHPNANKLCQGLELTVTKPNSYIATLFSLRQPPPLTGNETFSFSKTPRILTDDSEYYYYYMYPGSSFDMTVCIVSEHENQTGFVFFYLLKGRNNFRKWRNDDYSGLVAMDNFTIIFNCSDERSNGIYTYDIVEEDYYFLVYDGDDFVDIQLEVNATFNRTRYDDPNVTTIVEVCVEMVEYPNPYCHVSVPWSGQQTYFLTITPYGDEEVDYTQQVGLDTLCVPRINMYTVLASAASVALAVFSVAILILCVVCCLCKGKGTPAGERTPLFVKS